MSDLLRSDRQFVGYLEAPWTNIFSGTEPCCLSLGPPPNSLIFRCHFPSVSNATCCAYLAPSYRFEGQNDPQSQPKSPQNWSLKPSLLQSAEVLDNLLFTIRNGPQAALHRLQKPSKIGSSCILKWHWFPRPQKTQFQFQKLPTWPQKGSNLSPTWLHLGVPWGSKLVKHRP